MNATGGAEKGFDKTHVTYKYRLPVLAGRNRGSKMAAHVEQYAVTQLRFWWRRTAERRRRRGTCEARRLFRLLRHL